LGLIPRDLEVLPISSQDYQSKAPRPRYSKLNTEKLRDHFQLELSDWKKSLFQVLSGLKLLNP
ncbi:MAG: sugar nucleotide-binding protein, partial [Bdellovibrionaceae bacterium]|nr:sugar nucleotide-binding protein [Pseudobdellovibrionaceae bacterium]